MIKWVEKVKHTVKDGKIDHEIDAHWLIANETFNGNNRIAVAMHGAGKSKRGGKKK